MPDRISRYHGSLVAGIYQAMLYVLQACFGSSCHNQFFLNKLMSHQVPLLVHCIQTIFITISYMQNNLYAVKLEICHRLEHSTFFIFLKCGFFIPTLMTHSLLKINFQYLPTYHIKFFTEATPCKIY